MAAEGYIFAKLPKCYLMPQLQDWVMYRQGVVFSETDKSIISMAELIVLLFLISFLTSNLFFIYLIFFLIRKFDARDSYYMGHNNN